MRAAEFQSLLRVQRCVYPSVDDPRSPIARHSAQLVATQGIAGVDADSDYVTWLNIVRIELLQRFVPQQRIAIFGRCCRRNHEHPARRDNSSSKGRVTWVDQVNIHRRKVTDAASNASGEYQR